MRGDILLVEPGKDLCAVFARQGGEKRLCFAARFARGLQPAAADHIRILYGAAEQIPKDARGRFITGDGIVFQGYLFDEGQL